MIATAKPESTTAMVWIRQRLGSVSQACVVVIATSAAGFVCDHIIPPEASKISPISTQECTDLYFSFVALAHHTIINPLTVVQGGNILATKESGEKSNKRR